MHFRNSGTLARRTRHHKSRKMHFQKLWDSHAQNKNVGDIKHCTFRIIGTPVRRTKRRKYQQLHFQKFRDSCAQSKTSGISLNAFQKFWNAGSQNKTSEISKHVLSESMGLWLAEQNVGNFETCTLINSETRVRSTNRRKSQKMNLLDFG